MRIRSCLHFAASLLTIPLGVTASGASAVAATTSTGAAATASHGARSPEVPILFDDRTVHAKPSILKKDRVLAAILRNHEIYVPLRRMFERMGALVSASADGRTIEASKSGTSVSVTVGVPTVIIDGETRPLDVPPMLYRGTVLVPVRVISEALGAYVAWIPERRVVVVRYFSIAPTPAPAAPATARPAPSTAPPATSATVLPTAAPILPRAYTLLVQGDFAAPNNDNEFSAGMHCPESYILSAAYLLGGSRFAVKGDFREDAYVSSDDYDAVGNHFTSFKTIDGGTALTPVFLARQSSLDGRLEYEIASPRVYVGVGFLHDTTNYGYPNLNGVGFGVEKFPNLRPGIDFAGSAFYYPSASGSYTVADATSSNFGTTYQQQFSIVKYSAGLDISIAHSPVYLDGGFNGEHYSVHRNAPIGQTHDGPYLGLGVKL